MRSCVWVRWRPKIFGDAKIDLLKITPKNRNKIKKRIFFKVS
jgi:hypothetical protein